MEPAIPIGDEDRRTGQALHLEIRAELRKRLLNHLAADTASGRRYLRAGRPELPPYAEIRSIPG